MECSVQDVYKVVRLRSALWMGREWSRSGQREMWSSAQLCVIPQGAVEPEWPFQVALNWTKLAKPSCPHIIQSLDHTELGSDLRWGTLWNSNNPWRFWKLNNWAASGAFEWHISVPKCSSSWQVSFLRFPWRFSWTAVTESYFNSLLIVFTSFPSISTLLLWWSF